MSLDRDFLKFIMCFLIVSKDRDSGDSASGGGLRFRNHSPSSNRRSRERERTSGGDKRKDRDTDSNTLLITNDMTADHSEFLDDSRLSGKWKAYCI